MYTNETIAKYINTMTAKIKDYQDKIKAGNDMILCVSRGNEKIGHTKNVSTAALITCHGCDKICGPWCYDIKAAMLRKEVMAARARNTALALYDREKYFSQICDALSRNKRGNKCMRWHVGGEIIDASYLKDGMIEIAKCYPEHKFWTYTKNYDVVNNYIAENGKLPQNLSVMYSVWNGLDCVNPHDQPVFEVIMKTDTPDVAERKSKLYRCPGNCEACMKAGRGCVVGESAYTYEH